MDKKYFYLTSLLLLLGACEILDDVENSPDFTRDIVGNYSGTLIISGSDGNSDTISNQRVRVEKIAGDEVQFRPVRDGTSSRFPAKVILTQSYNANGNVGQESFWEVLDDLEDGGTGIEGETIGVGVEGSYDVKFVRNNSLDSIQYSISVFEGGVEVVESFSGVR